ncbi:MAG: hypothetical protein IPL83_15615 [Bdellovibrionales bacterium]|nr:hypothetical protein [Bdellovibrionales bacterium]
MSDSFVKEIRKIETSRDWKTGSFRFGLCLIAFELITGIILLFCDRLNSISGFVLLAHAYLGIFLIFSIIMLHFRLRIHGFSKGERRVWWVGVLSLVNLTISYGTALPMLWVGVTGIKWIWWFHVLSSFTAVLFLSAYVYFIIRFVWDSLLPFQKNVFHKAVKKIVYSGVRWTATLVAFTLTLGLAIEARYVYKNYLNKGRKSQTESILSPSHVSLAKGNLLSLDGFTNSKSCGASGCHEEIYKQWEESVHYRTPNPFVIKTAELLNSEADKGLFKTPHTNHKGPEVFKVCAACHSPVGLVTGQINHNYGDFKKHEGASCVLCHKMSKVKVSGQWVSYEVEEKNEFLFSESKSEAIASLHNSIIKLKPSSHKLEYMKSDYKEAKYCAACHMRLQYPSWRDGHYGQSASANFKTCQNCHMEGISTNADVSAKTKGKVASHRFLSAGFTMAKLFEKETQMMDSQKFIQDKRVFIGILSPSVFMGRKVDFIVRIANIGVGHSFPAGPESDLVLAWPEIGIKDEKGNLIFQYGSLDKDNLLDEVKTVVLRSVPRDVEGNLMETDRHRSWLFSSDQKNIIPTKNFIDIPFQVRIGKDSSRLSIVAKLRYQKPNQKYANWVFGNSEFKVPTVDVAFAEGTINRTIEESEMKQAREIWQNEKDNYQSIDPELKPRESFQDEDFRFSIRDNIILGDVFHFIQLGKSFEASEIFNSLQKRVRESPGLEKTRQVLREGLENSKEM